MSINMIDADLSMNIDKNDRATEIVAATSSIK